MIEPEKKNKPGDLYEISLSLENGLIHDDFYYKAYHQYKPIWGKI